MRKQHHHNLLAFLRKAPLRLLSVLHLVHRLQHRNLLKLLLLSALRLQHHLAVSLKRRSVDNSKLHSVGNRSKLLSALRIKDNSQHHRHRRHHRNKRKLKRGSSVSTTA